jgi:2-polyprenyl-6-methoxyphenol hydroxylase-like FAD-dependent oxidoreductase
MKAIIIGGGIGGVAAAVALERVGVECDIFEQAEEMREVGAGLSIWTNAWQALEILGAGRTLLTLGSKAARLETRTSDGRVLGALPLAELEKRLGVPAFVVVPRRELLRELTRLVDKERTHCRARCVGVEERAGGVIARFADGRQAEAGLLVGADGLHSVVRSHLHGNVKPRYAGYTCWRGMAACEAKALPLTTGFEAWGPGARFALHHCGPDRVFWYATHNAPEGSPDPPDGRKAEVRRLFRTWHQPIPEAIEATLETEILRNDIVDRKPLSRWGRDRMTLLGDAAHPTTPNLGQGACQALEDAVVLADCWRQCREVEPALRRYEQERQRRTAAITRASWRLGKICQWENPPACWLRNSLTQLMPARSNLRFMERFVCHELPGLPLAPKPDAVVRSS